MASPGIDAERVIADLRELQRRTGDENGAQRLCWGEGWRAARDFLSELLAEIGLEPEVDEAGNAWAYLAGDAEPALAVGSHVDSVPSGGWLDGALGVMGGSGVLRAWAGTGRKPPRTLALVDWADEEGARFGRSLFGSSAAAGTLDPGRARERPRRRWPARPGRPGRERRRARASARVQLAPGEARRLPRAAHRAGAGARGRGDQGGGGERLRRGRASSLRDPRAEPRTPARPRWMPATTPGWPRRRRRCASRRSPRAEGGVGTVGVVDYEPGIVTAVAGTASMQVDLRHRDADALARMLAVDPRSGRGRRRGARL